jgi:electron transfer flavoprotein alpha/beta subunit
VIVLVCLEPPQPGRGARAAALLARKLVGVVDTVAVSAGGPADSATLRWALESGSFQRIIHLDDPSLEKADHMTLGMVLAELARHVGASVVIGGEHSDVEGQGLVCAALAHHLRAPLISRVQDLRLSSSASASVRLEVTTRAAGNLYTLEIAPPLVVSVPPATCDQVVPLAMAGASAIETLTLAQLTIDPSRLVPRPELLGSGVSPPSDPPRTLTPDEAARFLLRRP